MEKSVSNSFTNGLGARVISAICLLVPAVFAIHQGGLVYNVLIAVIGGLMAWEWTRLCLGTFDKSGWLLVGLSLASAFSITYGQQNEALLLILPISAALLYFRSPKENSRAFWMAVGTFYVTLPIMAFDWLRHATTDGQALVYWLAILVWATDTGGYFAGKSIGGPKLAPKISPKKTWAGLIGGMTCAAISGYVSATLFDWNAPVFIAILSAALAVFAQIGDLFESHLKRHFGVKDSSNIIPGHGGVLDRLDGMVSAALVVAVILYIGSEVALSWF